MACARVYDGFVGSKKRLKTEIFLFKAGHRWPARPVQGPLTAADCIVNLWTSLDKRGDPSGDLSDLSDEDIELEAGWPGKPGLFVRALLACDWIDVSADGKARCWHDYGGFNAKALAARHNGKIGGRPVEPDSRRSRQGVYDLPKVAEVEPKPKPRPKANRNPDRKLTVTHRNPDRNSPESGVSESEPARPEDGARGCPRPPPPGSPSASSRTPSPPTSPSGSNPPVESPAPEEPIDDGSDMAEPAPRETKLKATPAQLKRRQDGIEFEKDLTRKLRLAIPHILRRWNEVADEIDKAFPVEQFPRRAEWIRYKSFPKSTKIRSALRARAREALKADRKFNDDFENALLGVRSMEFWTSYSKGWQPSLESFFVASKWETKIAAGQQVADRDARDEELERRKDEAFEMEMNRLSRETGIPLVHDSEIARNGKVTS